MSPVVVDNSRDTLYVSGLAAPTNQGFYIFTLSTGVQNNFIQTSISCGLALDSLGNLYWGTSNEIGKYDITTKTVNPSFYSGPSGDPTYESTSN